jgi:YHS domain-containing protein
MRENSIRWSALTVLLLGLTTAAIAGKVDPVYQYGGFAIRGYDAVAYYQQSAPVKGSSQFSYPWRGGTWLFANAENLGLFQADPERYAPQYGGYCAYAVSKGRTASIDPEAWTIVDGKLYLNYSKGVQTKWEHDVPGNIVKADKNWPDLHR